MFNKNNNNNTYLFPHDHHHHHHPPRPSVVDLNGVELFLHHHHHHHHPDTIFSGHHYNNNNNNNLADTHLSATNLLLVNQASDLAAASSSQRKAQTSKKDRHSKIFTSQGPRDRRVRLSIGIARKFFDLQEMLGFDKPSKTLDWLLTKSKAAIKDLIHSKHKAANAPSSSGGGGNDDENDDDDNNNVIPSSHHDQEAVASKGKSGSRNNTIKESRAKARARARERTREKMCIKQQMTKDGGPCLDSPNPFGINQQQQQQLGLFQSSSSSNNNREGALFQDQDLIQESVSVKRKAAGKTNNPSFFGFQQNVFVSRDNNNNNNNYGPSFVANNENWDVCSFTSQSNMCAILEHQKFMNSSSSNM